ncbi:ArsR/SmtB family transcription factor [Bremerella sp. T1]|uniref:ArsR/SmtB family transcription factor n=1 Tax=Bremerella sp. TYQ1 TaxID=3119568 RepID=UPI001CCB57BE|nr:metalloregulator ArsR/SmtB family transcription factor [Bremerella volcania]UBM35187.1 metalloregulator ArsR/SmtB family transcription factor [Bremerella volcania]
MNRSQVKLVTKTPQQYEARAKVAKAMAHPSRLFMLDLLGQRDMCVQELTQNVGCDQSTVSKHLAVLKDAGLIEARREGTSNFYTLTCGCLDGFFQCLETVVQLDVEKRTSACDGTCSV